MNRLNILLISIVYILPFAAQAGVLGVYKVEADQYRMMVEVLGHGEKIDLPTAKAAEEKIEDKPGADKQQEAEKTAVPESGEAFDFAAVKTDKDPIPSNKVFSFKIRLIPEKPGLVISTDNIKFDAEMPAHNHGMMTKPRTKRLAADLFRVDGVKLHMRGEWQLMFTLVRGITETVISVPYTLK